MNPSSRAKSCTFLLGLSALIMVVCLFLGGAMILDEGGGGFFPGLGKALGLVLIATGNLVSCLLNLICWYLTRLRWLGVVLVIQSLPAIALAGGLGVTGIDAFLEGRATDQRVSMFEAIKADDVPRLQQALKQCGKRCQDTFSPQRGLLNSSLYGSHKTARYFIDGGALPYRSGSGALEFYDAQTSLYTCEGTYLSSLNAVDLAVANQDIEMLDLLWPISDTPTRSQALWTAARLDRLDMVKHMIDLHLGQTGSPVIPLHTTVQAPDDFPLVRKNYRGESESLLRAAASGAAVAVGSWLLETRPVLLSPNEIQLALLDLVGFMMDTDTPRSVTFGRLLIQHGADLHAIRINDKPALERAVDYRSKAMALQLLELGAERGSLSANDVMKLDALLQEPDRSGYRQDKPGCVAP